MDFPTIDEALDMNLDELLNLVSVKENSITYCFSNDTINKLVKKENPLTRQKLSENVLNMSKNIEEGFRGLFDIGVLFGLYPSYPSKVNVGTDKGLINITRIPTDAKKRELVGNLFLIEAVFKDGTISPLFEISMPTVGLERIDELKQNINRLWYEGYFFNYWISSIIKYLNPESFPVIIIDPILLNAGDSIFDGNLAYELLKY